MPLKLPHKKKKDNAPQQEAEATEQQSVKRGAGKKKDHTEAKHRLRNTAFALIVVVLLGGGASVVSRHLSPKDALCKTIFLLDDKVNAVGFERTLTAVSRRKSEA